MKFLFSGAGFHALLKTAPEHSSKQGKGSTPCTLLVGRLHPQAPFTRSCDLWLWRLAASDKVQHRSIIRKEASMPANGENQLRHGGVVIVLYDHLCGDIDLFAECPG